MQVKKKLKKIPMVNVLKIIEQAKEMEKEQIVQAFEDGDHNYFYSKKTGDDFQDGKEYYKEIYGK
jgi:hypothetical protein